MTNLIVGIIQLNTIWENQLENKLKIESLFSAKTTKVDLLVLPEMFLTGFSCDQLTDPELNITSSTDWLEKFSKENQICVLGSLKIKDSDGTYKNRLFLTNPNMQTQFYDKRHLFPLSNEIKNFTRGTEQKIFKLNDWLLLPQICYDLRFPVWSRNTQNYDLMVNVANWPETRIHAWKTLLTARAIENQCFVIGVNRTGYDENKLKYSGDSLIINPQGEILLDAQNYEKLLTFDISKEDLHGTRTTFPFLKDLDLFTFSKNT